MKILSILTIIVGILVGLWCWQVDNIGMAQANQAAALQAAMSHQNGYVTFYNPVPVGDRAIGMAFAYLLCIVGGFSFVMSTVKLNPEVT